MIYSSDNYRAILAMERARTGNYGEREEIDAEECPICGSEDWDDLYYNDSGYVGCNECLSKKGRYGV